jgi:hypothetical protein
MMHPAATRVRVIASLGKPETLASDEVREPSQILSLVVAIALSETIALLEFAPSDSSVWDSTGGRARC